MADDPEIERLRAEVERLRHQADKVSGLEGRVRKLEALPAAVSRLDSKLDSVDRHQQATELSVNKLREMYERDRVATKAYHELGVAERRWQQDFARFGEARDLASGIIDVVGSGHIDRDLLLDVTKRLAIRTPRYWVAHATVAVAAWLDNRQEQHAQALEYALALDKGRTSLFMALVLRDQGRDEPLQEWLDHYLAELVPEDLPPDFQVVVDGVTGGALGGGAAPRLVQQMASWYKEAEDRQGVFDATVSAWKRRLLGLGSRAEESRAFPLLAACPQGEALAARHAANCALAAASRHFPARFQAGADVPSNVRESLSRLLRDLAQTPDTAEEELLATMREHRAVTLADGDEKAARARITAEESGRTGTLNIVKLVNRTAFPAPVDGGLPAPTVSELLAIMMSSRLIATAAEGLRTELPPVTTVNTVVGDRPWPVRFSFAGGDVTRADLRRQADAEAKKACDQIQKDFDRRQGRLQRLRAWACPSALVAAIGVGGSVFTPLAHSDGWLIAPAFAVGAAALAGLERLPKVVRHARDRAEKEKRAVTGQINALADELGDLWDTDQRASGEFLPGLRGYLGGLTRGSVIGATRPLTSVPLPRTREFPDWTPRPPRELLAIEPSDDLRPLNP
ncbi:MAG TPA: hypothetical protein VMU95_09380 [Trebonia sp.]|nr:hypothetical protein [Trebonia sp.]